MLRTTFNAGPPLAVRCDLAHPLARALVGCWLFNEGAGRTVRDTSGRGCHGSFSGAPAWAPSEFGDAIEFDGDDDWLDMGNRLNQGTDDITVCAIVKHSADHQPDNWFGTCQGAIVGKGAFDSNGKGYGLCVNTEHGISWEVRDQGSSYAVASDEALNDGRYHTVVAVCDRDSTTGLRLYIDGVRQAGTADPTPIDGHDLTGLRAFGIGSRQAESNGAWYWDLQGSVACVYVWKRVLCDAEIRLLQYDPFVFVSRRRSSVLLGAPAGQVIELAGSTAVQSAASGTLRVVRRMSGSTGATASFSALVRGARAFRGGCTAKASPAGALTTKKIVSLSGTTQAVSGRTAFLRVPFSRPIYTSGPTGKPSWLREALFQGATATGARLGTVLTQGWFWVRRAGCSAVYRGTTIADVDFDNVLCVAEPDRKQIPLPAYLSHDPMSRHYYVVRKFNGCGYPEQTRAAAVVVRVGPDGQLIEVGPNGIFGLNGRRAADHRVCLSWSYCPLAQNIAPAKFNIYRSDNAGQIDMEEPVGVVPYQGRRFYRYYSDGLAAGRYVFVVTAVSSDNVESASVPAVGIEAVGEPPAAPTVLTTELV